MSQKFLNLTDKILLDKEYSSDYIDEAKAESSCNFGVGCGITGKCYAKENGESDLCGRLDRKQSCQL